MMGQVLDDTELETNEVVQKGYEELRSWEWKYGQTPEFTHDLQRTLPGMDIVRLSLVLGTKLIMSRAFK